MRPNKRELILAQIAWEKKEETKVDFFQNLLRLQKETTKKKLEALVNSNLKRNSENAHIIH